MISVKNSIDQILFTVENNQIINHQKQVFATLKGNEIINSSGQTIMKIDGKQGISMTDDMPVISHLDNKIRNMNSQVIGKLEGTGSEEEFTLGACSIILYA
ncbi:MAG: major capsid protein P2 [Fulvivirga sp.]|uniref:hypothetical protein n=1 Tax=Fulvivirga sp. TaxID=1931237 RepID=UPI0032EEBF8A